jgi:hypothetical protein
MNNGTVVTNNGTVVTNNGTVVTNNGTVVGAASAANPQAVADANEAGQ